MKKLIVIALCLVANFSFGSTNRLDVLAKNLYDLTNGWYKLTYDPNSTATGLMCSKCGTVYRLPLGKVVKVGKSRIKCRNNGCNHTMWYVDEWMMLNSYQTICRNMVSIAGRELHKALSRGDNKEAEYWVGKLELAVDEMAKLAIKKKRYLERKKRR